MKIITTLSLMLSTLLVGCVGMMLPGRMYQTATGQILEFRIQTSFGNGKMEARDPQTGEKFLGEYSAHSTGQSSIFGNAGGSQIALFSPPTGANASGILVGDRGITIRLYFEIEPGLRPTGHGIGRDQNGKEYEVFF